MFVDYLDRTQHRYRARQDRHFDQQNQDCCLSNILRHQD